MPDDREEALLALSGFFVNGGTFSETLHKIAELARRAAPADMAGVTMLVDGRPRTGVFTDQAAPEIDQAQYDTGNGPSLAAFRDQRVYAIPCTGDERRWPEFAASAAAHGICATLSLPIVARGEGLGALNLYARRPGAFDDDTAARMAMFADQAAIVLSNAEVYWDAYELSGSLTQAIRSQATINHAIGILIATGDRSPENAFQLMVRASQVQNRKLRDVASEMVERAGRRRPDAVAERVQGP